MSALEIISDSRLAELIRDNQTHPDADVKRDELRALLELQARRKTDK